jgi:hypothetical protein
MPTLPPVMTATLSLSCRSIVEENAGNVEIAANG